MPTTRRRRTRKVAKEPLLDYVRILLADGPEVEFAAVMADNENPRLPRRTGKVESFMLKGSPDRIRQAWELHKDEVLRVWRDEGRTGKPWAERVFDGGEPFE